MDERFFNIIALSQIEFQLLGEDVLAVFRDYDALLSARDVQISFIIKVSLVTCMQPSVDDRFVSGLLIIIISHHH